MPFDSLPGEPTLLPPGGIRRLLRELGSPDEYGNPAPALTGCFVLQESGTGRTGGIYLRGGRVYQVVFEGFSPPIASRLHSGGFISAAQLEELKDLPDEDVVKTARESGYATADAIEDICLQMMLASLVHLYGWKDASWHWAEGQSSASSAVPGLELLLAVIAADERVGAWDALVRNFPQVTMPSCVPVPGPDWGELSGQEASPETAAILRHVDGTTNIARIAFACGFTRFEIASRLAKAIADRLIVVVDPATGSALAGAWSTPDTQDPRQVEYQSALAEVERLQAHLAEAEERLRLARLALAPAAQ